jgi:hypothetical protein
MLFVLFTEKANTYDEVVNDLGLQNYDNGKSTRIGNYKVIKGCATAYDVETDVAMMNGENAVDISIKLGRPIIYNPNCTKYGFKPGEFDGVIIILEKDFNIS